MSWWERGHVEDDDDPTTNWYVLENELQTLTGKQRFVIELRFGLRDGTEYTLAEIGTAMGVSRQAVLKIETAALIRLQTG